MTASTELYQHFDQLPSYQETLQRVLKLCTQTKGRSIVAIAGLPGSGKSTLAEYLAARANALVGNQIQSVSMDGFHLSKADLLALPNSEQALARRGAPWTFDGHAFSQSLKDFKDQHASTLYWPSFDHAVGDPIANDISIPSETQVLLVEGLYVLLSEYGFEKAFPLLDERWYIDSSYERSMHHLSLRHQRVWGLNEAQAKQRIARNDGLNAKIAEQTRINANWLISVS